MLLGAKVDSTTNAVNSASSKAHVTGSKVESASSELRIVSGKVDVVGAGFCGPVVGVAKGKSDEGGAGIDSATSMLKFAHQRSAQLVRRLILQLMLETTTEKMDVASSEPELVSQNRRFSWGGG